jgi:hypothetical protein
MQTTCTDADLTHLSGIDQVTSSDSSVIEAKHRDFDAACRCICGNLRSLALVLADEIHHQNESSKVRSQMLEKDKLLELMHAAMRSGHVVLVGAEDTRENKCQGKQAASFKSLDEVLRDVRILRHVAGHTVARRVKPESLV